MATFTGFTQFVDGPAGHYFTAVTNERIQQLLQIQGFRLTVDQANHVDAEYSFQLGLGKQVVDHNVRVLTPTQFDHHPDTFLVGFVPQLGDTFKTLFFYQLRDLLDQAGLVQLIRQLGDDDGIAIGLVVVLDLVAGTNIDTTTAGTVGLNDAGTAVDDALGREIRARNEFHQLIDGQIRIINQRQAAAYDFRQVVGRNVGSHAHGNTGGTIHQQVGHPGGQNLGNPLGTVVVIDEIDRFLVQVRQQGVGDLLHADLGVTHGSRVVTVDGTEVTLAINQRIPQGERLGHTYDGVVYRRVTVGVVFTDNITHHTGGLLIGLVPVVVQFGHGEQNAAVNRLEAIPHIRKRPPDDHAHGVIEVGLF